MTTDLPAKPVGGDLRCDMTFTTPVHRVVVSVKGGQFNLIGYDAEGCEIALADTPADYLRWSDGDIRSRPGSVTYVDALPLYARP